MVFTTQGHVGFSDLEFIFKKYPVPSIDNIFVLVTTCNQGVIEIQISKQYYGMRTLCKTNS